jgi:hypothetical protein
MDIPVVANVLGTMGAVCWSIQVLVICAVTIAQISDEDTAYPPNHHQLPPAQCYWAPAHHDDALGMGRRSSGRVQHCRGFQCCPTNTAPDSDIAELGDMDSVLLL